MQQISKEKIEKHLVITKQALDQVKFKKSSLDAKKIYEDFLDMATRYYEDAQHFFRKGDYINAFAAVNYAHAWLDAGARMKIFDVHDSTLFAAD